MVATVEPSSSISTQPERGERLLRYLIFQSRRQPKPNTEWRCHGEQYSGPTLTDLVGVAFKTPLTLSRGNRITFVSGRSARARHKTMRHLERGFAAYQKAQGECQRRCGSKVAFVITGSLL